VEDPWEDTVEDPWEDTVEDPWEDTVEDPWEDTVEDPVVGLCSFVDSLDVFFVNSFNICEFI
jgi:hypothetical protein